MNGLVDTNILIEVFRGRPNAKLWYASQTSLGVATIAWLEFIEGAGSKASQQAGLAIMNALTIVPLDASDQRWAMTQLQRYHLSHGFGYADCLIASIAYRLQVSLYTQNVKDFAPLLGTALVIKRY